MELKSNIKLKSNLYIRGTADGSFSFADEDYIVQIKTGEALKKLRSRAESSGAKLKLSEKQQNILSGTKKAVGDMPAVGAARSDSSLLPESVSMRNIEELAETPTENARSPITQAPATPAAVSKSNSSVIPETISMSGIEEVTIIPAAPVIPKAEKTEPPVSIAETPILIPDPSRVNAAPTNEILSVSLDEVPVPKADAGLEGFSAIADTDAEAKIVKAGLDSKVILDSVCYSEKIRIAEERIAFITENYPEKRVLVLCKTEIAAERISRSAEKFSSEHLNIATVDVFAAKYLSESGALPAAKITALSADEKIAALGEKMRTEDFANYDFCIIADLDELIAYNVKTLLKILVLMECGFLLLTDRRRAVLDHAPESDYGKNFAKLCDVLPESTEKLTITDTKHRLSGEIGNLLTAIAAGKPVENVKTALLSKMRSADLSKLSHTDGDTAVLCKNGGYAKYVSLMLRRNGIPHTVLLSGEKPAPVRQLADILWDTHEKIIARDNFIKRFVTRCGSDEAHADETFNMLCGLIKRDPSEGLELVRLAEVIMLGGIPMNSMNAANNNELAVAEINSASGRAFNTVFILADTDGDNSGKLLYLAAAGRTIPPALLKIGDIPELISGPDNHCVYVNGDQKPSFGLGDRNDVDYRSFIGGSMGDAVRKQAYISKNVKPGDSITLVLNDGAYDIVHGSTAIGKMSVAFSKSLTAEYGGKRYLETLPERIEGAYAANIFTVVSCCDPSEYEGMISPQFREHRFWYGVEIGGFGESV